MSELFQALLKFKPMWMPVIIYNILIMFTIIVIAGATLGVLWLMSTQIQFL
ncbi:MAG: hypothetical protein WC742_12280 [Gallionellaceae bacterium]